MLVSMTGFGKAACELENKKLTIEVKSLNSKQLDVNSRIPGFYKEKDIEIRNLISQLLVRGKVDFSMYAEVGGTDTGSIINKDIVKSYYNQISEIAGDIGLESNVDMLSAILRLPDTLKSEREELDDEEWKVVKVSVEKALIDLIAFRKQEGETLDKDIKQRVISILELLEDVEPLEKERIDKVRTRLQNNLNELLAKDDIDKNRFEQELIFYIEKLDITEEKVRLKHHCEYFLKIMEKDEAVGKKLGFISQEIGREINTLGSKANHSEMQKIVIHMKDELEKIKEQLLNVL